jgi:hypothetical protein
MATSAQVRAWLDQAEADLRASGVQAGDLRECHRRYWIQQSYEKAIKAYALTRWNGAGGDEAQFAKLFLLQHSPLKAVAEANQPLSKALHLLARDVDAMVDSIDNSGLLRRIDGTTPRSDPTEVSYRYPFVVVDGAYTAPASYDDWDRYQGNLLGARSAVSHLLRVVKDELQVFARTPK